jgi:MFS family permease
MAPEAATGTSVVHIASAWRFPQRPGELPLYVQRSFRVKVFVLISVQLLVVFLEMVLIELFVNPLISGLAIGAGLFTLFTLMVFNSLRDDYPWNYLLLCIATVFVGCFLGIAPLGMGSYVHLQVIGMLLVAMVVSTIMAALLTRESIQPSVALVASHGAGLLVASGIDFLVVHHWGFSSAAWMLGAIGITLVVLISVFFVDMGYVMAKSNPDDIFRVIVALDAALLAVGMPICLLPCCALHLDLVNHGSEQAEQGPAQPPAVTEGP